MPKAHDYPEVYKALDINLSKLGCVMLDLVPLKNMYSIEFDGDSVSLYYSKNPDHFWIDGWVCDKAPHITLLYGLLKQAKEYEPYIRQVLQGWEYKEAEIEDIGYFESPYPDEPYYCIVAHIKVTPELLEGNERLKFLPHVNTFMGYKPHMTICYIRKDEKVRDTLIADCKKWFVGRKLEVKPELNLGGNK